MNVTVERPYQPRNPTLDAVLVIYLVVLIIFMVRLMARVQAPVLVQWTMEPEEVGDDGGRDPQPASE